MSSVKLRLYLLVVATTDQIKIFLKKGLQDS